MTISSFLSGFSRLREQNKRGSRRCRFPKTHNRSTRLLMERLEDRSLMAAVPMSVYLQTNLISDQPGVAAITDASVVNAWGLAVPPGGGNFWFADNEPGVASVYGGNVNHSPLTKALPDITNLGDGPTGVVFNSTPDFVLSDGSPATFIFVTEGGTISGWNAAAGNTALLAATVPDAVFKGAALGNNGSENLLYAANFHAGQVDVFDTHFATKTLQGNFTDPKLPAGYAPFNIANIGGTLYVTFAQQDSDAHDEVDGPGKGFVDKFDMNGNFLGRFASRGALNGPWGMTQAPANFGRFSGDILVGNFGDGRINVFTTGGHFAGQLRDASGKPITIDGLWSLEFGNGVTAGDSNALYFTAGPDHESHGLFGKLSAATNLTDQTSLKGPKPKTIDNQNGHFTANLELRNESKTTITGPITIIFDRLPAGVTLNNATGFTADGKPFITLDSVSLARHQSMNVFIDFSTTGHLEPALHAFREAAVVQGRFG